MKILVIGSKGNMGRRYMAILKYLGVEAVGADVGDRMRSDGWDKAIIATPSDTHYHLAKMIAGLGLGFLCEKPIDQSAKRIQELIDLGADGRMVCNWAFVSQNPLIPGMNQVQYDNYNTGKDGLAWDCIQLIHLAKDFPELSTNSPYLNCHINGTRIHEGHIALSYKKMIEAWLEDPTRLWSLQEAKKATEKVIEYNRLYPVL